MSSLSLRDKMVVRFVVNPSHAMCGPIQKKGKVWDKKAINNDPRLALNSELCLSNIFNFMLVLLAVL